MNIENFLDEVKEAFIKAIGTSSSINEERDERSVENYVRTGGNTMENTTEPDPKGDIAVTKSFPTPNSGDLVDQTTRPEGDVSVSDAPNNPGIVPNQETIPSSATSAVAPTHAEMAQAEKVTITKSMTCPDCGGSVVHECMSKADEPKDADEITKADEAKETPADEAKETPAEEAAEEKAGTEKPMKKSLWGGAFAPVK
jgi:hypothetical protein